MNYQTIQVCYEQSICYIKLFRPQANNTINQAMVDECQQVLSGCVSTSNIVVLEGLPEVFCFGADFDVFQESSSSLNNSQTDPEALYELWQQLSNGSFVSIAHVRGKVNAGGIGFVSACDLVLADHSVEFSLSELLFDLYPACVLPFLIRRIGIQKAHYMTLTTKPINIQQASDWGLVDAFDTNSDDLLRKHLLRLKHLSKPAIERYKNYLNDVDTFLQKAKSSAVNANRDLFANPDNLQKIKRYKTTGLLPWESND